MYKKISKNLLKNFGKTKKRISGQKNVVPEPYLKTNVDTKTNQAISHEELVKNAKPFREYLKNCRLKINEIPVPMSPSLRPYKVENLKVGKKYEWCSCGMSAS